jgi:hypothetical protein
MITSEATSVCLNIGPAERRKRLVFGMVALGVTLALLVFFIQSGKPRELRLLLFIPWTMGALGIFQVLESTCVALAARGVRNLNGTEEPLPDAQREAMRQRARKVYIESLCAGALLTIVSLLP